MPKGPSMTPEQVQAEIERFRAMGGSFATLADETAGILEDCDTLKATLKETKQKAAANLRRLGKAEKALQPVETTTVEVK